MAKKKPVQKKVVKRIKLNPKGLLGGFDKQRKEQDAMLKKIFGK